MRKLFWVTLFSLGMAYLEAAVVVYLRMIYYPVGFSFPLAPIPLNTLAIELGREASTILMLVLIALIAGNTRCSHFAYFIFAFGVWDIFYYFWLKVILNWPASLFTSDILFLIPVPWVGPVLAPMIVSLTMVMAAVITIYVEQKGYLLKPGKMDWFFLGLAGFMVIVSFIWDSQRIIKGEMPSRYPWEILLLGEALGIYVFVRVALKRLSLG